VKPSRHLYRYNSLRGSGCEPFRNIIPFDGSQLISTCRRNESWLRRRFARCFALAACSTMLLTRLVRQEFEEGLVTTKKERSNGAMTVRMLLAHALHKSVWAGTSLKRSRFLVYPKAHQSVGARSGTRSECLSVANRASAQRKISLRTAPSIVAASGRRPVTAQEHGGQPSRASVDTARFRSRAIGRWTSFNTVDFNRPRRETQGRILALP